MAEIAEQKSRFVSLSNLPPSASTEDVQRFINSEAAAFNLGKLYKSESSFQSCEVELFNDRDVRSVLALNGKVFMGYEVTVEKLETQENPLEVFIKRIPIHASETDIHVLFSQFGKIEEVTLPRWHDTGKPRGFGFVRFSEKEHASKALQTDGKLTLNGVRLSIRPNLRLAVVGKEPRKQTAERLSKRMTERPPRCTTIYVGNVDFDASDEQISELFSTCGTVLSVRIVRQQFTNRSRGFAYIEFNDEESVTKAVAMDGQDFLGRKIRVDYAEAYDPDRSANRNFSTFTPRNPSAAENRFREYLPTPSIFIMDHFADNPYAGLAALAGTHHQAQKASQPQQQPHFIPATGPLGPQMMPVSVSNCSMPSMPSINPSLSMQQPAVPMTPPIQVASAVPGMQYFPNFFMPHATPTVYNTTPSADSAQLDATLLAQGIPGLGQTFFAQYAMLTQRAMSPYTNQATLQAKPPAHAPVASTAQLRPELVLSQGCFSSQDIASASQTARTQAPTISQQAYRIYSESHDGEPWESHDVNNAILY